jgi:anti-sigma regulatory factor (Ser/Thr protein kinase)
MRHEFVEALGDGFSEDQIWTNVVKPLLEDWPENVVHICAYGFTEMMNNANDHSGARLVQVIVELTDDAVTICITDSGIGIFHNLMNLLKLDDVRHAVFELTKGKITTDPQRHTGEGIFYTSRVFDSFSLLSGSVFLARTKDGKRDWLLTDKDSDSRGTIVKLAISKDSPRTLKEIFDHYASERDDFAFKKTTVSVSLAHEGDVLISRSQAKRIVARLEKFSEVVLDFEGIKSITPAFADEIFRVFRLSHPEVKIIPVEANPDVARMIAKAMQDAESQKSPP